MVPVEPATTLFLDSGSNGNTERGFTSYELDELSELLRTVAEEGGKTSTRF